MADKQRTIKNEVSLTGTGLHTGVHVTLTFKPAPLTMDTNFNVSI
jgi:UDP-3-O-[3-hydroxymyristoyl] N-acetylglucosamine deacetylase/3-hydroxyacyl-[acyl-carrier-protein] dehydratase